MQLICCLGIVPIRSADKLCELRNVLHRRPCCTVCASREMMSVTTREFPMACSEGNAKVRFPLRGCTVGHAIRIMYRTLRLKILLLVAVATCSRIGR